MFNKVILWFDWRALDKKAIVIEDLRLLFLFFDRRQSSWVTAVLVRHLCWSSSIPEDFNRETSQQLSASASRYVNIQYLFVCLDESQWPWKHLTCNPNADFVQRAQNRFDEYNKKSGWNFVKYLFNFFTLWISSCEKIGSLCLKKNFDIVR